MRDLAILVPSRGRPGNVARLAAACRATCTGQTDLFFGFDNDDPELQANKRAATAEWAYVDVGPRRFLGPYTNDLWKLARQAVPGGYHAYASLGDDHVPETKGWDSEILAELDARGGGIAWPRDNGIEMDWPEAAVLSASVVDALGWVCMPQLEHYCVDVVWRDIGDIAKCLFKMDTLITHMHPSRGDVTPSDKTYEDATRRSLSRDHAAWEAWRPEQAFKDAARVRMALDGG